MLNMTAMQTTSGGRYDLDRVKDEAKNQFVTRLLRHRHLLYDWGQSCFFTCSFPFTVDHEQQKAFVANTQEPAAPEIWSRCDQDELHKLLAHVFDGEWGPTPADNILRWLMSGVEVDVYGTESYGPKDPKGFVENLRKSIEK